MHMKVRQFAYLTTLAIGLAACASARTQTVETYSGAPLPRPDRVVIYDFAVSPEDVRLDQGIGPRLQRMVQEPPTGSAELEAARATQQALATALTRQLQTYGLTAERSTARGTLPYGSILLVQGQIVAIDEGNRARRVMIGLGAGKSSVTADAQLYYAAGNAAPRLLTSFEGGSDSGHAPGVAETMGAGAAADRLASSAAVGGAMHTGSERRGASDDANAERLAKSLATQIAHFAVSQGWIREAAAR
jgi:Domain of unknown function (DUF4410)